MGKLKNNLTILLILIAGPACGNGGGQDGPPPFQPLPEISAADTVIGAWDVKALFDYQEDVYCRSIATALGQQQRMIIEENKCYFQHDETELDEQIEIIRLDENSGCQVSETTIQTFADLGYKDKRYGEKCEVSYVENVKMEYDQSRNRLFGDAYFRFEVATECIQGRVTPLSCVLIGHAFGMRPSTEMQTSKSLDQNTNIIGHFSNGFMVSFKEGQAEIK